MADDLYGLHDDDGEAPGRDHLFLWTVFILLLIATAFACWLGSFYIFGHPEKARPYKLLKKLGKIDPPKRFEVIAAPTGEFLSAKQLFDRYARFTRLQLEEENEELLRNYIKNYKETKKLVPYIAGRFEIIESYELQKTDMFDVGVVAFAESTEFPQVLLEHVFPTSPENVAGLRANLPRGLDMRLEKSRDLAAVIHVERMPDGYLQFTVLPLSYGSWGVKGGSGVFSLEPPAGLNLIAGAPIIHGQVRTDALKAFTDFRRAHGPVPEPGSPMAKSAPELVRLGDVRPGAPAVPETGAMPPVPIATPIPSGRPIVGRPSGTPMVVASAATPRAFATPIPVATPLQAAPGVTLKPFIASAGAPDLTVPNSQKWRVYAPGRQPPGRTVSPRDAGALADRPELGERLYLRGSFVVTAAGEGRAVLRPQGASGDAERGGTGAARVIAEFPPSIAPPAEGDSFTREDGRGFEIRDVRRAADGQINIYVREITLP